MKLIDKAILLFLVAVFAFTGIDKILHYEGFVNALTNYRLLPPAAAPYLAMPVIAVELAIAVGLLIAGWRRAAALTGALTMALFTVALVVNYAYGERGICGCWFTISLARGTTTHIALNLMLTAMALSVWWEEGRSRRPAPALQVAD